jgi:hypothetical protein
MLSLSVYFQRASNCFSFENNIFIVRWNFHMLHILYFSILLHSFYTEYLFFCPSIWGSWGVHYNTWRWPCEAETCRRVTEDKKWMCYIDGQKNKYSVPYVTFTFMAVQGDLPTHETNHSFVTSNTGRRAWETIGGRLSDHATWVGRITTTR